MPESRQTATFTNSLSSYSSTAGFPALRAWVAKRYETMGVYGVQSETGAPVYIHPKDWAAPGTRAMGYPYVPTGECRFYDEGDTVTIGTLPVQVLYTPGHTPGGVTLICKDAMFAGDTLFKDSCGRVDLDGGDDRAMLASLKRLAELPGDFEVYPGHMETSTLDQERSWNPYLHQAMQE